MEILELYLGQIYYYLSVLCLFYMIFMLVFGCCLKNNYFLFMLSPWKSKEEVIIFLDNRFFFFPLSCWEVLFIFLPCHWSLRYPVSVDLCLNVIRQVEMTILYILKIRTSPALAGRKKRRYNYSVKPKRIYYSASVHYLRLQL